MSTEAPGGDAPPVKREVTITVSGPYNTGRSAMAQKIISVLREFGHDVSDLVQDDSPSELAPETVDEIVSEITSKVSVRVRTEVVLRNGLTMSDR